MIYLARLVRMARPKRRVGHEQLYMTSGPRCSRWNNCCRERDSPRELRAERHGCWRRLSPRASSRHLPRPP